MIISYVWVLETNTGATWRVAYLRTVRLGLVAELFFCSHPFPRPAQ
jgi:hypothetical protein